MKLLITFFLFFVAISFNTLKSQNITIPNSNFKTYLVNNSAINTNGDTEIQVSEAIAFTGTITCAALSINNLTGIEAFINLQGLNCAANQISSLNLDQNSNLEELICNNNFLTSLDISQNTKLRILVCHFNGFSNLDLSQNIDLTNLNLHGNPLTTIDLSQTPNLITLGCGTSQLTSLDVSQNLNLSNLYIQNNQITNLNLAANINLRNLNCNNNLLTTLNIKNGTNTNFIYFQAMNNPNLSCIEVDDATFSTNNWTNVDTTTTFSTACLTSQTETILENIAAYPNPIRKNLTIDLGKLYPTIILEIRNSTGQVVTKKTIQNVENTTVAFENFVTGLYFVSIYTKEGALTFKVIKEQ